MPRYKKNVFHTSMVFPEFQGKRGPINKQQADVFAALFAGELTGGGAVYQGGKGSGKTLLGAALTIAAHHAWPGLTSLIGRETYASLTTSTAAEFLKMLKRMPDGIVKKIVQPSHNSMGRVEWEIGGETLMCSLSNSDPWESANIGLAWVDEGHRQNQTIVGDLETRLRQGEGPRCVIYTTNPGGRGFLYHKAHPSGNDSRAARARRLPFPWIWVEASTLDNPTLPPDYHERLIRRYGLDTPAYRRWVKGQSSALEGAVFTEFDDKPEHCIHVVPVMNLPKNWIRGRGMDYGLINPTCVVWGAFDDQGRLWIDRVHYAPKTAEERQQWTVERHAEAILDVDEQFEPTLFPSDPSMWIKQEHEGIQYSTADKFQDLGVQPELANNDRQSGLQRLLDLIVVDDEKVHPITMVKGSPKFFVLNRPENQPLIQELMGIEWAKQEGSPELQRPDDCQKKNDHSYDAVRYLAMAYDGGGIDPRLRPEYGYEDEFEPVVGSRGRRRRY